MQQLQIQELHFLFGVGFGFNRVRLQEFDLFQPVFKAVQAHPHDCPNLVLVAFFPGNHVPFFDKAGILLKFQRGSETGFNEIGGSVVHLAQALRDQVVASESVRVLKIRFSNRVKLQVAEGLVQAEEPFRLKEEVVQQVALEHLVFLRRFAEHVCRYDICLVAFNLFSSAMRRSGTRAFQRTLVHPQEPRQLLAVSFPLHRIPHVVDQRHHLSGNIALHLGVIQVLADCQRLHDMHDHRLRLCDDLLPGFGVFEHDLIRVLQSRQRGHADIRVTALPGLQDPDEIVLENPEAWKQIIAKAKPVVVHVMETLAIGKDLNDAKVKRDIAAQVMPLIDDVGDSVEREAYRQQLAGFLRVDERSLKSARSGPAHSRRKKIESDQADVIPADMLSKPAQKNQMLERYLLHDLFLEPEGLFRLNKTLCNLELDPITESDFQNADTLAGYHLIAESLRQVDYTPSDFVEARLTSALEFEENPSFVEERHMITREKRDQHQVRAVVRMRLNRLEDRLEEIKFLQSDAVESKTYTEEEVQFLYLELLQKRRRLDAAMLAPEAGGSTRVRVASSIKSKSRDKA